MKYRGVIEPPPPPEPPKSPEQAQIDELSDKFDQEKKANRLSDQSQVSELRLKLLDAAEQWEDPELRAKAAGIIRATVKELPWSKKQKGKGVADRLAKLKG